MTGGAEDNEQLLHDPKSGVDVAFMHGGIVRPQERGNLIMLMTLYYEPLWIFYRGPATLTQLDELRGKQVAIGSPGSGVRTFVEPLLAANGITSSNTQAEPAGQSRGAACLAARRGRRRVPHRPGAVPGGLGGVARSVAQADEPGARRRLSAQVSLHHEADAAGGDRRPCAAHSGRGGQADRHQGDARGARRPVAGDHQPAAGRRSRIALPAGIFRRRRRVPEHRAGRPARLRRRQPPPALRPELPAPLPARSSSRPISSA